MVLWRPTRPSRTKTKKRCPFHHRGLECKSGKSRDTWNNRQIWPWSTEWSRAKANRLLPRERTDHRKHTLPTTQEMTLHMDITRNDGQHRNQIDYIQPKMEKLYTVSENKTGSWLWLRSWIPLLPNSGSGKIPHAVKQLSPCYNYWACALEAGSHSYWAHMLQLLKTASPRACAQQQEKSPQWEAHTPQLECSTCSPQLEKARMQQGRPGAVNK